MRTPPARRALSAALALAPLLLSAATVSFYDESLPTTLHPLFARSMVDFRSHELVYDRLFYRDAVTNQISSRLVAGWERLDEGRRLRLVLRQGVKWHDGEPLGPDDVCYTIRAMLDPAVPSRIAKDFREAIASCEPLPKENAAVVTFRKAFHNPREQLGFSVLPAHALEGQVLSPEMTFSSRPVGTGPMRASLSRQAVKYTATPNAHHAPRIGTLLQTEGGDPYVQVRTLLNAGVHGIVSVAPPLRPEVAASDDVGLKSYDLRSWWYVAVNPHRAPFGDRAARQALNHALDRTELRLLTIGVDPKGDEDSPCELVSGPFVQSSAYYNRAVPVVSRADPARVAALMTQAGASRVGGIWSLGGKPIALRVGMSSALDKEAPDLLNQIGNQLQAAGFDRQVFKIAPDAWGRKALTGQYVGEYDLLVGKWSFGLVEDVSPLFHTRRLQAGALNVFDYSNAEVDAILDRWEAATTDTQARDAQHALHEKLAQELPYLFLWRLDTKTAWRNEIRNNLVAPYYFFTEFDGWSWEEAD